MRNECFACANGFDSVLAQRGVEGVENDSEFAGKLGMVFERGSFLETGQGCETDLNTTFGIKALLYSDFFFGQQRKRATNRGANFIWSRAKVRKHDLARPALWWRGRFVWAEFFPGFPCRRIDPSEGKDRLTVLRRHGTGAEAPMVSILRRHPAGVRDPLLSGAE